MERLEERVVSSERPWQGRLIAVRVDEVALADGRRAQREVIVHPGAVGILAWDGERLATVRQWRGAAGSELLEIPAGTLEPGEDPAATARRELAEECGLAAGSWEVGPGFYTAPGFCTEHLQLFLAMELAPRDGQRAAADEAIETGWLTLPDALDALDEARIVDAKSVAGVLWLARRLRH